MIGAHEFQLPPPHISYVLNKVVISASAIADYNLTNSKLSVK